MQILNIKGLLTEITSSHLNEPQQACNIMYVTIVATYTD